MYSNKEVKINFSITFGNQFFFGIIIEYIFKGVISFVSVKPKICVIEINRLEDNIKFLFKQSFNLKVTLLIFFDNLSVLLFTLLWMREYYFPALGHPINWAWNFF